MNKIKLCWSLSDHTYVTGYTTFDYGLLCIYKQEFGHDYCEIRADNDSLYISFCGSNDRQDWIDNFTQSPKLENFREAFELFKNDICDIVKANLNKDIYVTGHSRGGNIAIFAAEYLSMIKPVSCITFCNAAPGNKIFREYYNKLSIDHTNVYIDIDILSTSALLYAMGLRHVGKSVILPSPWWWKVPPLLHYHRVKAHRRETVTKAVNKRFK